MIITIVCEVLGEPNNGSAVAAYNLINYLKSQGHEVRVVCPDEDKKGVKGYYVLPTLNYGKFINGIFAKNDVILSAFDKQVLYDACHDADIVHFMMSLFMSRKASKYIKSLGIPLTAGFHNQAENFTSHLGLINSKKANQTIYKWYDKNLYSRVDAIHYPTKFIKETFEKNVGRKTNGYVISNGVSDLVKPMKVEKPDNLKDKFCIVFTGRFSKEKSHIVLLKAVAKSKYNSKIQLFFAGQGGTKKKCIKYSKKHLVNQPIIDFYSKEELIKLLNMCDLYCHPAYAEIEAIACLEAIAVGLVPVIANSKQCATKAFAIDSRCLFKVNDPEDLASKIDYFIEHPEEKEKLSKAYLEKANTLSLNFCMKQMEQMFFDVIKEHKKEVKKELSR